MMKALPKSQKAGVAGVRETCACFDLQRDAWYKYQKRCQKRKMVHSKVVELVKEERKDQPRVGTRKLLEALHPSFEAVHITVGRDSLFDILREHNMLIRRKKASCKTTNSYHHFHKYGNLVKDMEITAPNQVWVADITYIRTVKGFCYLALRHTGADGLSTGPPTGPEASPSSGRVGTSLRPGYSVLQQSVCKRAEKAQGDD
jgi:putative transposase